MPARRTRQRNAKFTGVSRSRSIVFWLGAIGMVLAMHARADVAPRENPPHPAAVPPAAVPRYRTPALPEILINRFLALDWAEKTRLTIVPTMHLVETEHFLVCSAWNRSNDAALAALCERMYRKLEEQFGVSPTEPVWVGKCPIYLFWEPAHFARFISEVDHSRAHDSKLAHANGYHATKDGFSYVVINGVSEFGATEEQAKTRFFHVLGPRRHSCLPQPLHQQPTDAPLG